MLPSPYDLNYFLEVAHTLNMSRAAERLGITQPALTTSVQRLEHFFGNPLLIRTKTGVQLTRGGEKMAIHARSLVEDWEKIKSTALKDEFEIQGRYTLGCHPSVALYTLHTFFPQLLNDNPSLEIKLVHDLSRRITESVISFKIDFGIVVNPTPHPDLVIKELMKDEVSFWISKTKSPLQDTRGKGVLICDPDLPQSQTLMTQMAKYGLQFQRTVTSSNLEVITSLVSAGCGVGIIPGRVVARANLGLKPLQKKCPIFYDKICLIYRADTQKSKASQVIIKSIQGQLT